MTEVRSHISHRMSRSRIELQLRRSGRPLLVFGLGLLLMLLSLFFIGRNLPGGGGLTSTQAVRFAVPDATGVVAGRAEIRFKGIPAGTITNVDYDRDRAILTAEIHTERGPIYRNARAQLRPSTPLQDMYLDIVDRGTPPAGPAAKGGPLPESQTTSGVNVADVLQVFDRGTRVRLRTLLDQFGRGLDENGASLQTAFVRLVPLLRAAERFADQVVIREARTRRLMHNFNLLTRELGSREQQLRRLVRDGAATLTTLEAGSGDLDATLRVLPVTLGRIDSSFAAVRSILPDVDSAVRSLDPAVDALPSALDAARALGDDARPAVTGLQPSVRALSPLARQLRPLSAELIAAFDELAPHAPTFDHVTTSLSKCGLVLQRFFQWTQSVFALGDAHGEAPRGDAAFGLDSTGRTSSPRTFAAPNCTGNGRTLGGAPAQEFRP